MIERLPAPGTWLMRRLPMAAKLAVLMLVMLAAVGAMLWLNVAAGLLVLLYLMAAFYVSFMADLRHIMHFMDQTASGNLREPLVIQGRDEIAALSESMKGMVSRLSAMVASIRSNAALVANSGTTLATGNRELSTRTEQQAANLEQTSASVEELSSTVQVTAQTTQQVSAQAARVRDLADRGAQAMAQAVQSVETIHGSAKRMSEIVGVIDSLAFQTNILALNAAVEAARAGEQGRGFAVVASEVRSLAQRSAESAKEIRQLISGSSKQVATSVEQIHAVGANISDIVSGIRGVADNMLQISASSAAQSSTLGEITSAVRQLDEIT